MRSALANALMAQEPLLQGLLVTGAGYWYKRAGVFQSVAESTDTIRILYCAEGQGWCQIAQKKHPISSGEILLFPPQAIARWGSDSARAWTIHWVQAQGKLGWEFMKSLGVSRREPKRVLVDSVPCGILCNEIYASLAQGLTRPNLLNATWAFGHLLGRCGICVRETVSRPDAFRRIGECIEFMSEHLSEPIRVGQLARQARLSAAHFAVVFKEQTGSTPRDYLHLLRMHRACQWLTTTLMPLKEIAARLGYQDQFHFSRKFKAFAGLSPSQYRFNH